MFPFSSSSPMFNNPTLGLDTLNTCSAKRLPNIANWFSISGLQSAFAPTSSKIPNPDFNFGTIDAMAGRNTPGIAFTLNIDPTSIAPVLPADANESISLFFKYSNPFAILELGF
ncbi:hypothetical protein D3C87_1667060 [compost metagenome]